MQLSGNRKPANVPTAALWLGLLIFLATVFLLALGNFAFAQGSLGVGRPEPAITPSGPFASILFWIQQQQKEFYRALTEALKMIRSGNGGTWLLVTLSFGYGVLHAAGPGHGKAVISSYMLANEVQLRRGILLSFISSILQALVAIMAIGLLVFVLTGFGIRQSGVTRWLEIISYAGVTMLGLWLIWKKTLGMRAARTVVVARTQPLVQSHGHATSVHATGVHSHHHHGDHHHHHHDEHGQEHQPHDHHHHHHEGDGHSCNECGHAHAPDPRLLEGRMGLREAVAAVMAVGLRPCTGALIVLTFAFLNGLYAAGILSAFAMAIGTAITVSTFATMAVGGKNLVLRYSASAQASASVLWWIEMAGALFILFIGITLLSAAMY